MKFKSFINPAIAMLIATAAMPAMAAGGSSSSFWFGHPGDAQ